ncbi:MAG: hypothetical protein Q9171_007530 [Xanthocarpia ochracea]
MQCYTEAKITVDQPVAAEASIIPVSDPSSHTQAAVLPNSPPVTALNLTDNSSGQATPPILPKLSQTSPDLNRPDSAYGGSGGTPSLLSANSIDTLSDDITPPPKSLLHSHAHQQLHSSNYQQPPQQDSHHQSPSPTTDDNNSIVDNDPSGYADSAYDDTASLNESITDTLESAYSRYRWENGRRYHSYRDGAYWGPNDETHNDQQDIAHHAWRLALNNQLYLAPVQRPERILDVGTGTGIWAIEMAERFPEAQVVGTDLSPIQPIWVPPNCMFEVDDVTMEWTFRKDSFDFIHSREMFGSIADWDEYFRQCYLHLKPGGYVEALERGVKPVSDDGTVGPEHFWTTWGNTVLSIGETWGKGFNAWENLKERMEAAGFVDVVQVPMKWPIGPWMQDEHMKELGMWNALRLDTGLEGYVMRLFTMAGGVGVGPFTRAPSTS